MEVVCLMRAHGVEGDGRHEDGRHACKCAAWREGDGQRWPMWWVGHAGIRLKNSFFFFILIK